MTNITKQLQKFRDEVSQIVALNDKDDNHVISIKWLSQIIPLIDESVKSISADKKFSIESVTSSKDFDNRQLSLNVLVNDKIYEMVVPFDKILENSVDDLVVALSKEFSDWIYRPIIMSELISLLDKEKTNITKVSLM